MRKQVKVNGYTRRQTLERGGVWVPPVKSKKVISVEDTLGGGQIIPHKTTFSPWLPGQSGNPLGKPRGAVSFTAKLRAYLKKNPDRMHALVEALVNYSLAGNASLMSELINRLDGKVVDRHQVDTRNVTLIFKPVSVGCTPRPSEEVEVRDPA